MSLSYRRVEGDPPRWKEREMKLMTKEIERRMPAMGETEGKGDEAIVQVKFFFPAGAATWYALEYDPEARIFFGLADLYGDGGELGDFSLDELESVVGPMGLKIERDLYFTPKPLKEVRRRAS